MILRERRPSVKDIRDGAIEPLRRRGEGAPSLVSGLFFSVGRGCARTRNDGRRIWTSPSPPSAASPTTFITVWVSAPTAAHNSDNLKSAVLHNPRSKISRDTQTRRRRAVKLAHHHSARATDPLCTPHATSSPEPPPLGTISIPHPEYSAILGSNRDTRIDTHRR